MNYSDLLTAHTKAVSIALAAASAMESLFAEVISAHDVNAETMDRVAKLERTFIDAARKMVVLDDALKIHFAARSGAVN